MEKVEVRELISLRAGMGIGTVSGGDGRGWGQSAAGTVGNRDDTGGYGRDGDNFRPHAAL
jgi:hypothetical protein